MDAGLEGLVHGAWAVGREEENATVVLQLTQECGHQDIAADLGPVALHQKYVSFVKQQDATPLLSPRGVLFQHGFALGGLGANVAGGEGIKRAPSVCCNGLGGASFARARWTMEKDDQPLSFAGDQVNLGTTRPYHTSFQRVPPFLNAGGVVVNKCKQEFFVVTWYDQVVEPRVSIGVDIPDRVDVHAVCAQSVCDLVAYLRLSHGKVPLLKEIYLHHRRCRNT